MSACHMSCNVRFMIHATSTPAFNVSPRPMASPSNDPNPDETAVAPSSSQGQAEPFEVTVQLRVPLRLMEKDFIVDQADSFKKIMEDLTEKLDSASANHVISDFFWLFLRAD